jgi:hypothetical protein
MWLIEFIAIATVVIILQVTAIPRLSQPPPRNLFGARRPTWRAPITGLFWKVWLVPFYATAPFVEAAVYDDGVRIGPLTFPVVPTWDLRWSDVSLVRPRGGAGIEIQVHPRTRLHLLLSTGSQQRMLAAMREHGVRIVDDAQ